MRVLGLGLLLALPFLSGACLAKSKTERIEVSRARMLVASIEGATAEQFTIWSGPGTTMTSADGTTRMSVSAGDFADWNGGAVAAPRKARTYEVSFFCKACEPARSDTWRCYAVRYAPGDEGEPGYIQIPGSGDDEYETNVRTIYRGVEGHWFRASEKWDALIRARIEQAQAQAAERAAADALRDTRYYLPPPKIAVGARPAVTPKK